MAKHRYSANILLFGILSIFLFQTLALGFQVLSITNNSTSFNYSDNKLSQSSKKEFVEGFDSNYSDRYSHSSSNGVYSQFDTSVGNGFYNFNKNENTTLANPDFFNSSAGTNYDISLKCGTLTNVSNENCAGSDLSISNVTSTGFLSGWNYRKLISITGSTDGALTNYNLDFTIWFNSGTDTSNSIYLDNLAQNSFADIRFTTSDGSTLLPYFLIQTVTGNSTHAIVQVSSIPAYPTITQIYIYYGNSGASYTGDGWSVAEFYDDFDNSTTLSTARWSPYSYNFNDMSIVTLSGTDKMVKWDSSLDFQSPEFAQKPNIFYNSYTIKTFWSYKIEDDSSGARKLFAAGIGSTTNPGEAIQLSSEDTSYFVTRNLAHSYVQFSPQMPWMTVGKWYNQIYYCNSYTSGYYHYEWLNNTKYTGSIYGTTPQISWHLLLGTTGTWHPIIYVNDVATIVKTRNEPTFSYTSIESSNSVIGLVNTSNAFTGVNRDFVAVNVNNLIDLENIGTTVTNFKDFYLQFSVLSNNLQSDSSIEVFMYNFTESELLNYANFASWSNLQKSTFWNSTSQPYISKTFNYDNFSTGTVYLNITDLANQWFLNRTSQTLIGFGLQLYNLSSLYNSTFYNNDSYISLEGNMYFNYTLNGALSDYSYSSLSTQLDYNDNIVISSSILYVKTDSILSNANSFAMSIIIESNSGQTLLDTYFFRTVIYDSSGQVNLQWSTTSSTMANYSTGITLKNNREYRFTFDISKTDGKFAFSILNSSNYQILRPHSWQNYVSDEKADRPSIINALPLGNQWGGNASISNHKRGIKLLFNASSNAVFTGNTEFHIDNIYSTSPLLDTSFYCAAEYSYPTTCMNEGSYSDFDDLGPYSAHYNNLSQSYLHAVYQYQVRDFRSFIGLMSFNSSDVFSDPSTVQSITITMGVKPILQDGSYGTELYTKLYIWNTTGGFNVWGVLADNITLSWAYPKLPAGHASVDFGLGFYWLDTDTLALTTKYYDVGISTTNPISTTTYGNYNPNTITPDVFATIDYEIVYANNTATNGGQMQISDVQWTKGRNEPYIIPSIPTPDVPFIPPPTFLDQIVNGLTGFTTQFLSGDWFGALGGVWDTIVNVLGGIADFVLGGLADLFWLSYNWLASYVATQWDTYAPSWLRDSVALIWGALIWFLDFLIWCYNNSGLVLKIIVLPLTLLFCLLYYNKEDRAVTDLFRTNVNPLAGTSLPVISIHIWLGFLWLAFLFVIFSPYNMFGWLQFI